MLALRGLEGLPEVQSGDDLARLLLDGMLHSGAEPADGDVVVLVKPQFEAGRPEIGKRGVVRDPAVRRRVVDQVAAAGDALGLTRVAEPPSPIPGAEGNREVFLHLRHGPRAA